MRTGVLYGAVFAFGVLIGVNWVSHWAVAAFAITLVTTSAVALTLPAQIHLRNEEEAKVRRQRHMSKYNSVLSRTEAKHDRFDIFSG